MSKERTSAIPMESVPDVSSIDDLKRLKQTNPARFEKLMKIDVLGRQRMARARALTQRDLR
jgi:hypothetical protein